ncbi:ABC transporter permease [Paenibacillus baekrokdamisoli]|uniref:ABC transporter permease n=1 Tax=Paenibacillus baekrokdamisoli TaxID=1712516 RepID=A0A3G9IMT7_9BACL|nr:ABC transporter permease [Paenibacillus baekrokdamisoli]MBB3072770.1 putative ABC transport system permease protein [Paenibacillus baekrokdamisoli]BBH20160.1 ABC transporter permease [Paenibacillus baekrokdamisoli]
MTFRQFAFNNVLRNKRTYAAYFLSSAFSVMVFFVYAVFAFHPDLADGKINMNISTGMHFAEGLIYVFSFFFVLYSMSTFLKTRKKEFGLMVMLGMTNTQLRTMVFLENVLIGFFATVTGILMGLVMSKLMLLAAENFLELDESLPFYLPIKAIFLTFGAFVVLFVLISLFTVVILRANKLIDLIKGSSIPKKEPKSSILLSWIAALLLAGGYTVALIIKGIVVVYAMIPVTLIVIVGTYFLFTQLSVYIIHKFKNNRSFFWRKTNMLFLSDLAYRMKDNARTFFMVAVLSSVAFSAIGSLVGFKTMSTEVMVKENPFAFEYIAYESNQGKDAKAEESLATIASSLQTAKIDYKRLQISMSDQETDSQKNVTVVKASEYNAIAKAADEQTVDLRGNQSMMVYYTSSIMGDKSVSRVEGVRLATGNIKLDPLGSISSVTLPLYGNYYVISDTLFDKLNHEKLNTFYAFDVDNYNKTFKVGESLTKKLSGDSNRFKSLAYDLHQMNQGFGLVMFIGLFIGAVFFVAAGSFLYFRLYADLPDDKFKFTSIMKLGLTEKELSKILTRQLLILFFVPIVVATAHGAVALTSLQHLFGYSLMKESFLVLGTFVFIQMIYFLLIRSRYIRQVLA